MKFELFNWTRLPAVCRQAPQILIAYEDAETFRRAKVALNGFFGGDAAAHQGRTDAWKFDLLQDLRLLRLAVDDATTADLIVISAHGNTDLPAGVRHWIDCWVDNKTMGSGVLVALLESPFEGKPPANQILECLRTAAVEAQFDWFPVFCELSDSHA